MRVPVRGPEDYAGAFQIASDAKAQALFVMDNEAITKQRVTILDLATKHALPVVSIIENSQNPAVSLPTGPTWTWFIGGPPTSSTN